MPRVFGQPAHPVHFPDIPGIMGKCERICLTFVKIYVGIRQQKPDFKFAYALFKFGTNEPPAWEWHALARW